MQHSESITKLSEALAKAQAEMPSVKMNAVNPFLKNKYADLGAVIETARPVLAKHGLSVAQFVGGKDGCVDVTTILMHSSGEWIESTVGMTIGEERGKSAAQVAGSIVTYLRRYSLASALGMYSDEDTDGNQTQPRAATPAASASMTYAEACAICSSEGIPYGDIPTDDLTRIAKSAKAPEEKRAAAALIIKTRETREGE